jgi:hypothetical protein
MITLLVESKVGSLALIYEETCPGVIARLLSRLVDLLGLGKISHPE